MKTPETYEEAVAYIEDIPKFTKKHSLEHTREFLRRLGNPAIDRKIVHVAGTNGKGSVCAYIQAILEAEGKKTAFFTSPHLVKINERIQIGREAIGDEAFFDIFLKVYRIGQEMEEEGLGHPSYFEFLYGMGMCGFRETDAEYIILETGLGGRLDATNAIFRPFLTVLTSISLDHTEILGDTIEKIALEKAGIIKENVPVIFDGKNEEASRVIIEKAKSQGAPYKRILDDACEILEVRRNSIAFLRTSEYDKSIIWRVPFCGVYQVMNAELAIQAAEYLLPKEQIHKERWVEAVFSIKWEGRMEEIRPRFLVDGAHNPGAVEAFVESVTQMQKPESVPPVVLFSAVSDKNYEQMIRFLCQHLPAQAYIVTEIEDKRKVPAAQLQQLFSKYTDQEVVCEKDLNTALSCAFQRRGEGDIYCLGSLYLVGMIKKLLKGGKIDA